MMNRIRTLLADIVHGVVTGEEAFAFVGSLISGNENQSLRRI